MMQGDACNLAVRILNNAGNPVTPADVSDVEITLGPLRKSYKQSQLYHHQGLWMFPLSQQESVELWPGYLKVQVRIRWLNGVVEGKTIPSLRLCESLSKEVL